jgi:hypothetical protein
MDGDLDQFIEAYLIANSGTEVKGQGSGAG